ncbi:MAG: PAS domain-containing protein [Sterolibacteriaceae bacterium]|nr:PAS domain-containing protein [Sterolibacteriaceae bacterium]
MELGSGSGFVVPARATGGAPDESAAIEVAHATLILDIRGRILSCGEPAARLLGASQARLMGRWISEFITGLFRAGSSPSFCARYLAHLCADDEWRRFEAVDGNGQPFLVDASLARMASGRSTGKMFLLNLRRPA